MTTFYLPSRIQVNSILSEDVTELSVVKLQSINTNSQF